MNAHGVAVEERYARPILSSFHASWSLGGLAGAARRRRGGVRSACRRSRSSPPQRSSWRRSSPGAHAGCCRARPTRRRPDPSSDDRPARSSRSPRLAFAALFAEGAAGDWSAVYLHESVGTGESLAAVGIRRVRGDDDARADRRRPAHRPLGAGRPHAPRRRARDGRAGARPRVPRTRLGIVGFACLGAGLATIVPDGLPRRRPSGGNSRRRHRGRLDGRLHRLPRRPAGDRASSPTPSGCEPRSSSSSRWRPRSRCSPALPAPLEHAPREQARRRRARAPRSATRPFRRATKPTASASVPAARRRRRRGSSGGRRIRGAEHPEVGRRLVREQLDA